MPAKKTVIAVCQNQYGHANGVFVFFGDPASDQIESFLFSVGKLEYSQTRVVSPITLKKLVDTLTGDDNFATEVRFNSDGTATVACKGKF